MSLTQPLKLSFLVNHTEPGTCGPIDMIKIIEFNYWALVSVQTPKQDGFGILTGTQLQKQNEYMWSLSY